MHNDLDVVALRCVVVLSFHCQHKLACFKAMFLCTSITTQNWDEESVGTQAVKHWRADHNGLSQGPSREYSKQCITTGLE